jgi:RND family efflux transporter MFP subunit
MIKYKSIGFALALASTLALGGMETRAQDLDSYDDYGYDGFLEPSDDVLVSAVEIGRLESVNVKVGDRVVSGQTLATLEDGLQVISLEIAEKQATMKGELEAALAERTMHHHRTEQIRALLQQGTARPDELIRAETDLLVAQARVLVAEEEQANRQLEKRRQEIQLQRRKITSPIDGVVARVLRQPGEYISPSESAIVRVIAGHSLVAVFNLPAADATKLKVGQIVPLRPRTVPRVVQGKVESIAPAIDGESGTVAIRLRVDNSDESLFPGDRCMMGNVKQLATMPAPSDVRPNGATRR